MPFLLRRLVQRPPLVFSNMTPKLKLTYFDLPARAEPIRLALTIGKVPFEDVRVAFADWPALRPTTPLNAMPVFEVDGKPLSQSMAITRYVGTLTGLYPTDDAWKAALIDEIADTLADFGAGAKLLTPFVSADGLDRVAEGQRFAKESIPRYWGALEERVKGIHADGPFVFGEKVSLADVGITVTYNMFVTMNYFDGVPVEVLGTYKRLKGVFDAVMAIPEVVEWYKKNPFT